MAVELPTPEARVITDVTYDFSGRSVLITGAARGVGRSHAKGFADAGASLVICDIREEELEETAEMCRDKGVEVEHLICDVADSAAVDAMMDSTVQAYGKIDTLVNNAGLIELWDAVDMPEESWDRIVDSTLKGTFLCARSAARKMIEAGNGGTIINTGSGASIMGVPMLSHYTAAKHGVAGLTKSMAIELAPHKITVNYVCPTAVATQLMPEGYSAPQVPETAGEDLGAATGSWNLIDEGMPIAPEEVTNAVLWLASDASNYMTGTAFVIDAGFTCK